MSVKNIVERVICEGRLEIPEDLKSPNLGRNALGLLDLFVAESRAAEPDVAELRFNPEYRKGAVSIALGTDNVHTKDGISERVVGKISAKCAENLLEALLQWKYGSWE